MSLRGKKLGLLLSTPPHDPAFRHGVRLAAAALQEGVQVYLYCIDDAIAGIAEPCLQELKNQGLALYACAYAAQRRHLPSTDAATFAGLGTLANLIAFTDRFLSFGSAPHPAPATTPASA